MCGWVDCVVVVVGVDCGFGVDVWYLVDGYFEGCVVCEVCVGFFCVFYCV